MDIDNTNLLNFYKKSDFSDLPLETKKMMCNKVLIFAMKTLWLEEILIDFKHEDFFSGKKIDAMFVRDSYTIYVNVDWLVNVGIADFTATILHESRHAYQSAQVEFYDYMIYKEPIEKVKRWKQDFDDYVPSSGHEHNDIMYMSQSVEIDAVAFEVKMMKDLLDIDITPHELIAEDVAKVEIFINEIVLH